VHDQGAAGSDVNGWRVLVLVAGVLGSELYVAIKQGREAVGCELKPSYYTTAVRNLEDLEATMGAPSLF